MIPSRIRLEIPRGVCLGIPPEASAESSSGIFPGIPPGFFERSILVLFQKFLRIFSRTSFEHLPEITPRFI